MSRYIVTDASGNILRQGYAATPAAQAKVGETAYTLAAGNGAVVPDGDVKVTGGAFAAVGGYAGALPTGTLSEVVA